jgi:hypothetical protein
MQVWTSSTFTLLLHFLDPHVDGVQFALPFLITTTPSEDSLSQFLFIAWYIWKARIDIHFQRKNEHLCLTFLNYHNSL